MRVLGLSGSLRQASLSTAVLRTLTEEAPAPLRIDIHSLADIPLYNADLDIDPRPAPVQALLEAIAGSDGLLISTPEYNYGMPGLLKNAIDWASRPAWASVLLGKPALIVSQSPGAVGGARAHSQVRDSLAGCGARVVARREITITLSAQKISDGRLVDPETLAFALDGLQDLRREVFRARAPIA